MRIGSFDVFDPLPQLVNPHALAILQPWINVGNIGTLALSRMMAQSGALELAKLAKPGTFYDFTRYRPIMYFKDGQRELIVPNSMVSYAKRETGNDLVFLHMLEPHMFGELYSRSVSRLLRRLGVRRYTLIGSMYDMVPHTRPPLITGRAFGEKATEILEKERIFGSDYQGSTSITYLIARQAALDGLETMSLIAHVPQYAQWDDNYTGLVRLLEVLGSIYGFSHDEVDIQRMERQQQDSDTLMESDPQMKSVVAELETYYDARQKDQDAEKPSLSPQIEKFLAEMEQRFNEE